MKSRPIDVHKLRVGDTKGIWHQKHISKSCLITSEITRKMAVDCIRMLIDYLN